MAIHHLRGHHLRTLWMYYGQPLKFEEDARRCGQYDESTIQRHIEFLKSLSPDDTIIITDGIKGDAFCKMCCRRREDEFNPGILDFADGNVLKGFGLKIGDAALLSDIVKHDAWSN